MFSGGAFSVPTSTDEALGLREQMTDQADVVTDANQSSQQARNGIEDANSALSDARTEDAQARQEADYWDSQVRGKQQALEQAIEQMEMYLKNLDNEKLRLEPDRKRIQALIDQANFQHMMFKKEIRDKFEQGCQEIFQEQQLLEAEVTRLVHALKMRLNAAITVDIAGRPSASTALNRTSLFSPRQAGTDQGDYTDAQVDTAQRTLDSQLENIAKRAEENPYEELVEKKRDDLALAQGEKQKADSEYAAAEGAEQTARNAQKGARDVYDRANEEAQEASNELNVMQRGLQQYADNVNAEEMRQRKEAMERQSQQQNQQQGQQV